jgi:hypothetical protein
MQPDRQQPDAAPVVQPLVDERQFRSLGVDEHGGECGSEMTGGGEGWHHRFASRTSLYSARSAGRVTARKEQRGALEFDAECRGHRIGATSSTSRLRQSVEGVSFSNHDRGQGDQQRAQTEGNQRGRRAAGV